jgi:hypothetical protein
MEKGMDLREALTQISEIRQQVARTQTFRGYRAAPVAFSGVVAWIAAFCQFQWMPAPASDLGGYVALWVGAAFLSVVVTGLFMWLHCWQSRLTLTRSNTALAVGQFLPCVVAGGLLAWVLFFHAHESVWMLPGLWSILFSLGIFASWRLLPKATFWVGVYYLIAGIGCLMFAQGEHAFSPWAMALPFGLGQLLAAGVLYWTLERPDGENETSSQ